MSHSNHHPGALGTDWSLFMSAQQPGPYDEVARKWHALAARRQAYVEELRDSGRWRRYYDWEELLEALREAASTRETWARLAGLAPEQAVDENSDLSPGPVAAGAPDDWLDAELFRKAG